MKIVGYSKLNYLYSVFYSTGRQIWVELLHQGVVVEVQFAQNQLVDVDSGQLIPEELCVLKVRVCYLYDIIGELDTLKQENYIIQVVSS